MRAVKNRLCFCAAVLCFIAWAADNAPIGVFDSGLGGLTVLERLLDVDIIHNDTGAAGADGIPDLANESFVYLGDQANMPYGDYAAAGRSDLLREMIWDDAAFLRSPTFFPDAKVLAPLGRKSPAKIIVIACNTATAWGLDVIRARLAATNDTTQVIGVIEAGVRAVFDTLAVSADTKPFSVGVMATPGTIQSGAYEKLFYREWWWRFPGRACPITLFNQGCAGLADAVEADSPAANQIAQSNLVSLAAVHRAARADAPLRAVILGCTHYPFVQGALEKGVTQLREQAFPISKDFTFVDPACYVVIQCRQILQQENRLASAESKKTSQAFLSVAAPGVSKDHLTEEGALNRAFKYGRTTSTYRGTTRPIPFTPEHFGPAIFTQIEAHLPATAQWLKKGGR